MNDRERTRAGTVGVSRRTFLETGATAGVLGLAGCVGGDGGNDGGDEDGEDGDDGGMPSGGTANGTDRTADSRPSDGDGGGTATTATEPWRTTQLTDVRTDERFTVAGLEGPVLLEFFAVWCPVCTDQQGRIATLHERRDDFVSVSINTDPNEDAATVREHLDRHGFDWRYAVAPTEMTRSLREAFGPVVLSPPQAPMVLRCPDGTATLLETGVKSVEALSDRLDSC